MAFLPCPKTELTEKSLHSFGTSFLGLYDVPGAVSSSSFFFPLRLCSGRGKSAELGDLDLEAALPFTIHMTRQSLAAVDLSFSLCKTGGRIRWSLWAPSALNPRIQLVSSFYNMSSSFWCNLI